MTVLNKINNDLVVDDMVYRPKVNGLPLGDYYIKLWGGEITTDTWDVDGWQYFNKEGDEVVEVLSPVPTYEEYWHMISCLNDQTEILNENTKLKELLRRARKHLSEQETPYSLIKKIDEVLK